MSITKIPLISSFIIFFSSLRTCISRFGSFIKNSVEDRSGELEFKFEEEGKGDVEFNGESNFCTRYFPINILM